MKAPHWIMAIILTLISATQFAHSRIPGAGVRLNGTHTKHVKVTSTPFNGIRRAPSATAQPPNDPSDTGSSNIKNIRKPRSSVFPTS